MVFDTDVLIWAARGNRRAAKMIDAATDRAVSIISVMELLQGARSNREARQIKESLRELEFSILPLTERIGSAAASLIEQYALAHGIQVTDALIAATAIEADQPLCTAKTKHFRPIRGLSRVAFRP